MEQVKRGGSRRKSEGETDEGRGEDRKVQKVRGAREQGEDMKVLKGYTNKVEET